MALYSKTHASWALDVLNKYRNTKPEPEELRERQGVFECVIDKGGCRFHPYGIVIRDTSREDTLSARVLQYCGLATLDEIEAFLKSGKRVNSIW